MDRATKARLDRGVRTLEILKQGVHQPMSLEKQVASLYTVVKGHVDDIPVQDVTRFEAQFLAFLESNRPEILHSIRDTKDITADNDKALVDAINTFKKSFAVSE